MKTRELLACEARLLGSRLEGLKPQELRRHIDRIAADLGEPDTDALLSRILEATRSEAKPQGAEGAESGVDRVFRALQGPIAKGENRLQVLRLMTICMEYLRQVLKQRFKELRRAEQAKHRHDHHRHEGHWCGDPNRESWGRSPGRDPSRSRAPWHAEYITADRAHPTVGAGPRRDGTAGSVVWPEDEEPQWRD